MATLGDRRRVLALHVLARRVPAAPLAAVALVAALVALAVGSAAANMAGRVAEAEVAQRQQRPVPTAKKFVQPGQ